MPLFSVTENQPVASAVWRMVLQGDVPALRAGSFVEVAVPGCYLRRPFSVSTASVGTFSIIYKIVGKGTDLMTHFAPGQSVDVLVGLGNGFDAARAHGRALIVGGGLGVAPLCQLAKDLHALRVPTTFVGGFNTAADIFCEEEFRILCDESLVYTLDGSAGRKGLVTACFDELDFDYFFACGPLPMLKAVAAATPKPGQLSLEARMGCGYGVCMGCSIETNSGPMRVCKEGPVFEKEVLPW